MWHKKILSILIKIKANKKKVIKIGLIVGATGAFVCSVYIFYWLKTKGPALAQTDYNNVNTRIVCEEPIPIGIAIENTIDLLDKVYLTNQGDVLDTAKERVKDLITIINANGNGNICDFNKCTAQPENIGGMLYVIVSSGIGGLGEKKISIGKGWPPLCKNVGEPNNPALCGGDPCGLSGLSHFIKKNEPQANNNSSDPTKYNGATLEDLAAALGAESNNIKEILGGKNKVVTEDIAQEDERVGETKISDTEYVLRYIDYVEKYWLTPSPLGNTCALSKTERERVKAGKMGEKYPKSCLAALADKTYSPKPWSETCEKECESGDLTNECRECLAECEGNSIFARINCKLYRKDSHEKCKNIPGATNKCCGEECADGLTPECYSCLCPKTAGNEKAAEQCLDWICGGSRSNWVCCHEEPIEQPVYYVSSWHHSEEELEGLEEPDTYKDIVNSENKELEQKGLSSRVFVATAYGGACFPQLQRTSFPANNHGVIVGDIAAPQPKTFSLTTLKKFWNNIKGRDELETYFKDGYLPYQTKVRIKKDNKIQIAKKDKTGKFINGGEGQKIGDLFGSFKSSASFPSDDGYYYFCVCDTGGDIKKSRIDIYLPEIQDARNFGANFLEIELVGRDEECCKENNSNYPRISNQEVSCCHQNARECCSGSPKSLDCSEKGCEDGSLWHSICTYCTTYKCPSLLITKCQNKNHCPNLQYKTK